MIATPENPLAFRPLLPGEAAEARELVLSVWEREFAPAPEELAREFEAWPAAWRTRGGEAFALLVRGALAGFLALAPDGDGGALALRWWCLAPAHRGGGLGRFMLERALAWARRQGAAELVARAPAGADAARALLAEAGFRPEDDGADARWARRFASPDAPASA